ALESPNYLKWNSKGPAAGDLVFVSGNPGSTARLDTLAELELQRDDLLPLILKSFHRRLDVLGRYSAQGPEQARQALRMTFGTNNTVKALEGRYQGLLDKSLMAKKQKDEEEFRRRVDANP